MHVYLNMEDIELKVLRNRCTIVKADLWRMVVVPPSEIPELGFRHVTSPKLVDSEYIQI